MVAMAFGTFMDGLDSSIVNIALPSIAAYFGTDTGVVAWVTIVYFMMIAGLMLIFGRLADSGHIRKIYVIGFALFGVASLFCGISENLPMLVASRVVQGIGAAMLAAVCPMMCVKYISSDKLGLSMSILMLTGALGYLSGPAIGGFIVDLASWHWAFLINVPIGIAAIVFSLKVLPKDSDFTESKLDLMGSATIFIAVISGIYIIEMFSHDGQQAICSILAVVMVIAILMFIRAEKTAKYPVLRLSIFRDWKFDSTLVCYLLLSVAYVGASYVIPFYLTKELELSYTMSGLLIMIPSIFTIIISIPAGRYGDLHGRRMLCIISTAALTIMSVCYWMLDPGMGWLPFIPIGVIGGIVWGLGGSVASRIIDQSPESERGIASTLSNFVYYAGGSIGTALFATLMTVGSGTSGIPIDLISPEEFMAGYGLAMLVAIIIAIVSLFSAWVVKDNNVTAS